MILHNIKTQFQFTKFTMDLKQVFEVGGQVINDKIKANHILIFLNKC